MCRSLWRRIGETTRRGSTGSMCSAQRLGTLLLYSLLPPHCPLIDTVFLCCRAERQVISADCVSPKSCERRSETKLCDYVECITLNTKPCIYTFVRLSPRNNLHPTPEKERKVASTVDHLPSTCNHIPHLRLSSSPPSNTQFTRLISLNPSSAAGSSKPFLKVVNAMYGTRSRFGCYCTLAVSCVGTGEGDGLRWWWRVRGAGCMPCRGCCAMRARGCL